jgi:hypothetical protein
MPERVRLDSGVGMLGDVPDLTVRDGKLTEETALSLSTRLRELVRKVNREISFGNGIDGYRAGNLDAQFVDIATTPAIADTEFTVIHGLKRVPIGYIVVRKDRACDVYDSSIGSWTGSLMYLKCNVAAASVKLLVF